MKGIVSNPNIAPHIKESVFAYHEQKLLANFYTTFVYHKSNPLTKLLSFLFPKLIKELRRRSFEELPYSYIRTKPYRELLRVVSSRKLNPILTDKIWEKNELNFDNWVAKNLKPEIDFIHVFEHASLSSIKKAKKLNIISFYEQPSIHHKTFTGIINQQLSLYPAFETKNIKLLHNTDAVRRNKRRDEELKLADFIICNSTFTKNSLINGGVDEIKIITIPLGFPETILEKPTQKKSTVLKFLSAGNLSMGKGSHILLEAWKEFSQHYKNVELWLVGKNNLPAVFLNELPDNVIFFGNLTREELFLKYNEVNVLVHPTLADGFGMVITEAMSCGLPVITTYNCCGPDIIDHQVSGLLFEANSKKAIIENLIWCVDHTEELNNMANNALQKAKSYPWPSYRTNLTNEIKKRLH